MDSQPWLLLLGVLLLLGIGLGHTAQRARDAERTAQLELGGRARRMLVETDDALRGAERELAYARATFGADEAAGLASALDAARVTLDAALALGRRIEDEVPESTEDREVMLDRIVADCTAARTAVDVQLARLAELRAIAADPDAAIVDAAAAITAQAAAIDAAMTAIEAMRTQYAGSSLQGVTALPAEALAALTSAQADLEQAHDAATPPVAAVHVRAANLAIARSRELSGAVQRQADLLVASADRLGHLREDAVAAIDAAQTRLDELADTRPATDPSTHELTLARDQLSAARTSLQEADAVLAMAPRDVQAAAERLTAAITLAGSAANALASVSAGHEGAERTGPAPAALAGEAITPATDALGPDLPTRTSHVGHSEGREALEQAASATASAIGQALFELAFNGVTSIAHGDGSPTSGSPTSGSPTSADTASADSASADSASADTASADTTERVARLHEEARAAIEAAEQQLAASAPTVAAVDPATHERTVATDRLTSARMSLAAADAAKAMAPDDITVVMRHLTAAIASAGAAVNALSSVSASRMDAGRTYASAATQATESIAQAEAWLEQGSASAWEEPRFRDAIASARMLLDRSARLASTDPAQATAMAWNAHRAAVKASAELDPDRARPPSHAGHSPEREVLEEVGATLAAMVRIAAMGGSLATDIPVRDDPREDDPDGDGT